jgi:hypothetical protein
LSGTSTTARSENFGSSHIRAIGGYVAERRDQTYQRGRAFRFWNPLAGDADGLFDGLGLLESAEHVLGDVGA